MAKQRVVNTKFWDDSYIIKLDPTEKLLFLYFLTNPMTDASGIYEITLRRISFDTGIDTDMVLHILKRFETALKIYYVEGWIYIRNFARHQVMNENMQKGVQRSLKSVPPEIMAQISTIENGLKGFETVSKGVVLKPKLKPKPKPKLEPKPEDPVSNVPRETMEPVKKETENNSLVVPKINYPVEACEYLIKAQHLTQLDKPFTANLTQAFGVLDSIMVAFGVPDYPSAFEIFKQLVDFGVKDSFHGQHMTSMFYIKNSLQRMLKQMKVVHDQKTKAEEYKI